METCTTTHGVPMEPLDINFTHPVFHSPEVLRAASGGDSREFIGFYTIQSSEEAQIRILNSIVEMQAFLVTLVRKFDISPADHRPQIKRIKTGAFTPLVLGEEYKGPQLPLRITAVRNA